MNQSDLAKTLDPVIQIFHALEIPYYIGGSVASSAFGIARMTMDIDLVADIKSANVPRFVAGLQHQYYIDQQMILNAINQKGSFNLLHLETFIKVDIFILKDEPYYQALMERIQLDSLDIDNTTRYYFASAEDIILTKLNWYQLGGEASDKQWKDILGVFKVQKNMLDKVYLQHWANHLKLHRLLNQLFAEIGD